jgi:hypothetical protein
VKETQKENPYVGKKGHPYMEKPQKCFLCLKGERAKSDISYPLQTALIEVKLNNFGILFVTSQ